MSTWIFLRGWAREVRHWGEFPYLFADRVPGTRVITLDLPGNGRLRARRSPATVGQMVEQTRALLREQGENPPFCLLGLSLGAMVSMDWASRHAHEIAASVLVSPSVRPYSPWYDRLRPSCYAPLVRLALFEKDARARESAVLRLTSAAGRSGADVAAIVSAWTACALDQPVSRANVLRQLIAAARYKAPPVVPDVPSLVLAGAMDRLVHPRCSQELAQRWKIPIAVHPDAGHDVPLDAGPWVAMQVKNWLDHEASHPAKVSN